MNFNKKYAYFGTDNFSIYVLEKLLEKGFIPELVITAPDRPAGRGQQMKSPELKTFIEKRGGVKIIQPEKLDENFIEEIAKLNLDFFIVASYGKIIPEKLLQSVKRGTLNVHPSLLPLYRGASPIETAILEDQKETGVTIMLMDKEMDHGPILEQEIYLINEWPAKIILEKELAEIGGELLAEVITPWLSGEIEPQDQEHEFATFTKKIKKEDGFIEIKNLAEDFAKLESREVFLKIKALNPWPGVYFFIKHLDKEIRIKITDAEFIDGKTKITKVIPEGKKEMAFEDFKRGFGFNF